MISMIKLTVEYFVTVECCIIGGTREGSLNIRKGEVGVSCLCEFVCTN